MNLRIYRSNADLAAAAATTAATVLRKRIVEQGSVRVVAATGASQLAFLEALVSAPRIDWTRVELFHLDEYVGLPIAHPASFRRYLLERLIHPTGIRKFHLLDGCGDLREVCRQVGTELNTAAIDLALVGIGENGHLAFNDPPADFETEDPYLVVRLDEACRRQQVGEGWFKELSEVPQQAISMSVRQIMKAQKILCVVPDERKALAVKASLEGAISPEIPASILQMHGDVTCFLDARSASLLKAQPACHNAR